MATPGTKSAMKLPKLETQRLYRRIAELLETRIYQGLFPAGSFLPPERELAEQLSVSRTSVREALIALEVTGRVAIRHGQGVQVLAGSQSADPAPEDDIGPVQIMEARRQIEPKIAELAAINHTPDNLAAMRAAIALQEGDATSTAASYHDGDRLFHLAIAQASGNPAYEVMIGRLWEYRTKPLFARFERLLIGPNRPGNTITEHLAIYEAVAASNAAEAGKTMRTHLDAVLRAFIKGGAG